MLIEKEEEIETLRKFLQMYLLAKREHIFLTYTRNSGYFYTFTPNFFIFSR